MGLLKYLHTFYHRHSLKKNPFFCGKMYSNDSFPVKYDSLYIIRKRICAKI